MDGTNNSRRFAEMEALMSRYFDSHLAPVMRETQSYLTEKQGEEMKEYSTSLGGILSMMASAGQPLSDPYQTLKATGEWNSKTTEDYVAMCKERILSSKEMQQDLAFIAGQWRNAVVQEVGRERYDQLSRELGCDLAYAFVDYRVDQLMIDKLVKDRMPKSSAEYIIRKAAESSLLGLSQTLSRSPLAEEIERRGETAYRPSKLERGTAKILGASADTVMLGGVGSWTTFARFVGADAAISAVAEHFMPKESEGLSVEHCISKGAVTRTCSTDSVRKRLPYRTKRTRLSPKPTESYRKRYRSRLSTLQTGGKRTGRGGEIPPRKNANGRNATRMCR